jgi:hypothetical protein
LPYTPNWMTGWELASKERTTGAWMPVGRRRTAELTRADTCWSTAFLSVLTSKDTVTRLFPMPLVEFMSVIPATDETAFSIICVTCWSTTVGLEPG